MGAASSTVSIPTFPFLNRISEREAIQSFIKNAQVEARVFLIEGEGGVGKTRLLGECLSAAPSDVIIAALNARDKGDAQRSLLQSLVSESKRLRSILASSNRLQSWKFELRQVGEFARRVIPSAGSLVPVVGAVTKSALEVVLENKDPASNTSAAWANHLLAVCGLLATETSVIIVIDDFHRLSSDEKELVSTLLSGVIEVENRNLRTILSTRPLELESDASGSYFDLPAHHGELSRLRLLPLSDTHLTEIAEAIFFNPDSSNTLVGLAQGSPQKLLELIAKMNINGDLRTQEGLVVLPTDLAKLTYLIDSIWPEIKQDRPLYDLAAMLAVGTGSMALKDADLAANALGFRLSDVLHASTLLEQLGVFELDSAGKDRLIRFSHDLFQEQIAARIRSEGKIAYIYYAEISARYLTGLIERASINGADAEADLLSLRIAQANCLFASAFPSWEEVLLSVAKDCLREGRYRSATQLASLVVESFSPILASRSPVLTQALSLQIQGSYAIGDYQRIPFVVGNDAIQKPYTRYAVAMATIIEKKEHWYEKATELLESSRHQRELREYLPLFESARAVALRENGNVEAGESILTQLVEKGGDGFEPFVWHQFLSVASVFRGGEAGSKMAETAFRFFEESGDVRMAGISANNLSISLLSLSKFEAGLRHAVQAEERFKQIGSEDMVFPQVNQAAALLSLGDARSAQSRLRSCLFRKLPNERRLCVLNNLALSQWASGQPYDREQLEDETVHGANAWLRWISRLNLTFLELDGGRRSYDGTLLHSLRSKIIEDDPDLRSAPFWNWLLAKYEGEAAEEMKLEQKSPLSVQQNLADPSRGIGRPVFLSFGRV